MDEYLFDRLRKEFSEYARARERDSMKGLESPVLSALIVQKYGYGMAEAIRIINDFNSLKQDDFISIVDKAVEKIDPDWQKHQNERWEARPADLVFNKMNSAK